MPLGLEGLLLLERAALVALLTLDFVLGVVLGVMLEQVETVVIQALTALAALAVVGHKLEPVQVLLAVALVFLAKALTELGLLPHLVAVAVVLVVKLDKQGTTLEVE